MLLSVLEDDDEHDNEEEKEVKQEIKQEVEQEVIDPLRTLPLFIRQYISTLIFDILYWMLKPFFLLYIPLLAPKSFNFSLFYPTKPYKFLL